MASILPNWPTARSEQTRPEVHEDDSDPKSGLDWPTARDLKLLSLGCSSISLLAGCFSIYWLVRMRRSFRYDLILLLIAGDFIKSLWFCIYSTTTLNRKNPTRSASRFCQVSGFFFSVGIEASDAAVFLIALHWAVYIFRSNTSGGESGIYPYRHTAFALYVLFPTMMASLAFVAGSPAYVDLGQYCYLPATPWWYRMSLSWIPRYINMSLIIVMYSASYMYIRLSMRRFSKQNTPVHTSLRERWRPASPTLVRHGLISSPSRPRPVSFRVTTRRSLDDHVSYGQADEIIGFRESLRLKLNRLSISSRRLKGWPRSWKGFEWGHDMPRALQSPSSGLVSPVTAAAEPTRETGDTEYNIQLPVRSLSTVQREGQFRPPTSRPSTCGFYRHPIFTVIKADGNDVTGSFEISRNRGPNGSQMQLFTVLQHGPGREDNADPTSDPPSAPLDYGALEAEGTYRSRDRIRRQLRFLFIYPAVYTCTWVLPFVEHVINHNEDHSRIPFWIPVASLVSLCVQGLADAALFCFREKPWRLARGGFWENFRVRFLNGMIFGLRKDSGRTKEEMFHDGARARLRREEEREREQRASRAGQAGTSAQLAAPRNWWDTELPQIDEDFECER